MVKLIECIWLFKCVWNCVISSLDPFHIIKMSSMNLVHWIGGVPLQDESAISSTEAINKLAKCGAHLVPIATPDFCVKKRSLKEK